MAAIIGVYRALTLCHNADMPSINANPSAMTSSLRPLTQRSTFAPNQFFLVLSCKRTEALSQRRFRNPHSREQSGGTRSCLPNHQGAKKSCVNSY